MNHYPNRYRYPYPNPYPNPNPNPNPSPSPSPSPIPNLMLTRQPVNNQQSHVKRLASIRARP